MTAQQSAVKGVILLSEAAARGERTIEIGCGWCERLERLFVEAGLARYGSAAVVTHIMPAQIGSCPGRRNAQMQNRWDPYCSDLVQLFAALGPG